MKASATIYDKDRVGITFGPAPSLTLEDLRKVRHWLADVYSAAENGNEVLPLDTDMPEPDYPGYIVMTTTP